MRIVTSDLNALHRPPYEVESGVQGLAHEVPERISAITEALCQYLPDAVWIEATPTVDAVTQIHDLAYITFLREICANLPAETSSAIFPSVFPNGVRPHTSNVRALHGTYCFDTYTPLLNGTFDAAIKAASTATEAATILLQEGDQVAYALCRPPGHHAERARSGGYCYFNNSAAAADLIFRTGRRVAVLDVDAHHGNGTQQIFWEREILTVSIHGEPAHLFPYFSGYADEIGEGFGAGLNRNFPLPVGSGDSAFQATLEAALEVISPYAPDCLVVAFGVDTHIDDPIGKFELSTPYFGRMAATIGQLRVPILVVQEGGYGRGSSGEAVATFLKNLEK